MTTQATPRYPLTNRPKLRLIHIEYYVSDGQPVFVLMDPLRLVAEHGLMVSVVAGGALIAADGTRTLPEIRAFIAEHSGLDLPVDMLQQLFAELDRLALLDNERFMQIKQQGGQIFLQGIAIVIMQDVRGPNNDEVLRRDDDEGLAKVAKMTEGVAPLLRPDNGRVGAVFGALTSLIVLGWRGRSHVVDPLPW